MRRHRMGMFMRGSRMLMCFSCPHLPLSSISNDTPKVLWHFRGCLGLLCSMFFSSAPCFLAKRFQLHALCSRKKGGVVRAPKEILHKLQFFVKLLHGGVCGAEFVEQSQTPPKQWIFSCFKHVPIITKLCSAKLISASSKNLSISSVQI